MQYCCKYIGSKRLCKAFPWPRTDLSLVLRATEALMQLSPSAVWSWELLLHWLPLPSISYTYTEATEYHWDIKIATKSTLKAVLTYCLLEKSQLRTLREHTKYLKVNITNSPVAQKNCSGTKTLHRLKAEGKSKIRLQWYVQCTPTSLNTDFCVCV